MPIFSDTLYSGWHRTRKMQISGPLHAPPPPIEQIPEARPTSIPIGAHQPRLMLFNTILQSVPSLSALLCWDTYSSITSVQLGTSLFHSVLCTPLPTLLSLVWELINSHLCSSGWNVVQILDSALWTPPHFGAPPPGLAFINPIQHSLPPPLSMLQNLCRCSATVISHSSF